MPYLKFDKTELVNLEYSLKREVLRTNRAGSYSCTTIINCNTRKYHGLLICPLPQVDNGRHVLLSTLHETVIQHEKEFNLGLHKYEGDVYEPKGHKYIRDYTSDPIPKLLYRVGGVLLSKEMVFVQNEPRILIKYTLVEANSPTRLKLKPFLAFRNIHALSKANMDINQKVSQINNGVSCCLYNPYPALYLQISKKNEFVTAPDWYYNIEYIKEQSRGYDYKEDLFVPGYFEFDIKKGESIIFSAGLSEITPSGLSKKFDGEISRRTPRDNYQNCIKNAASQMFINNKTDINIIAGYPYLPIRSRDALIALPGLTIYNNEPELFDKILKTIWKQFNGHIIKENLTESDIDTYQADTPLWLIWAIQQWHNYTNSNNTWKNYGKIIKTIINGFINESKYFTLNNNKLIYSDGNYQPCSWMSGLTQRQGYLVETNALWYNAICFAKSLTTQSDIVFNKMLSEIEQIAKQAYVNLFYNNNINYLADYVTNFETNYQVRCNQIIATAMPFSPLDKDMIKGVVDIVKQQLLTPLGIRTLAPYDADYIPKYGGNHFQREKAANNGSVYSWLLSFYTESMAKVQPKGAIRAANRFFAAIENEIQVNGLCTLSEVYHGDPPHLAKGSISFALSISEFLRIQNIIEPIE